METRRSTAHRSFLDRRPSPWAKTASAFGLCLPVILCLLMIGTAVPSSADIILLTNGKTLEGTLEELGNGKVRVRLAYGSLSLSRDQIATVHPARTFEQIVEESLATLDPGDAGGRYRLARQARSEQAHTLYRRLLAEVLEIDPDHQPARRELGFLRHQGQWVTMEQLHALRGEVSFRGEWITPQARDRILVAEAEARQAAGERQRALAEARREAEAAARAAAREPAPPAGYVGLVQPAGHVGLVQPGCGSGLFGAHALDGAWGPFTAGPAFQPLRPFQPGLIQVPNQTYRYSLRQTIHARPGPAPRPHVGYRADPPPRRR